jgi:hypothetical protein
MSHPKARRAEIFVESPINKIFKLRSGAAYSGYPADDAAPTGLKLFALGVSTNMPRRWR